MMAKVGTLKELGVGLGDVIRIHKGFGGFENYAVKHSQRDFFVNDHGGADSEDGEYNFSHSCGHVFRLISRASDTPKLWRDMTPEEKGALLLAAHERKVIEWSYGLPWVTRNSSATSIVAWSDEFSYRIRPEPKVETVTLMTGAVYNWVSEPEEKCGGINTHRITFNLIDGKPDCASVKMDEL